MLDESKWLTVGKIVAPQGLKGDLRIKPQTEFPERFTEPGKRWLHKEGESPYEIDLLNGRKLPGKMVYIIKIKNVKTRATAENLVGASILVTITDRPNLKESEYHFLDLIGLKVKLDPLENQIGEVIDLTTEGNDLLEIKLLEGKKILVPFVSQIVPEVDIKKGYLIINPPPGLLEL